MGTEYLRISTPTRKGRKAKWGVDYYSPWDIRPDGRKERVKRFFRTKDLRDAEIDRLTDRYARFGASTAELPSPDKIREYREAVAMLPPGVSLVVAVSAGIRSLHRDAPKLTDFIATYCLHQESKGLSSMHRGNVKSLLGRFAAHFPVGTTIAQPTAEECREWLAKIRGPEGARVYKDETMHGFRRILHGLFEFAMTEGKRDDNPIDRIAAPKVQKKAPGVYSVNETRAILAAAVLHDPGMIPGIVLRLFAGIRSSEVRRMIQADIHPKGRIIDLPGFREVVVKPKKPKDPNAKPTKKTIRVTKSGKRRIIEDAPDVLWDWLTRFPTLDVVNYRKRLEAIMALSGVRPVKNAFRHNFATYHVSLKKSANLTILILGQEEDSKIFYERYRNPNIGTQEAEEYFALTLWQVLPWTGSESNNQPTPFFHAQDQDLGAA